LGKNQQQGDTMRTCLAKWTCVSLCLLAIAGCGSDAETAKVLTAGDFEGDAETAKVLTAGDFEGAWLGTDEKQNDHIVLVLENGDIWVFYGPDRSASPPAGFVQGNGYAYQPTALPPGNPNFTANDVRTLSVSGAPYNASDDYLSGDYDFGGKLDQGPSFKRFTGRVTNGGDNEGTAFADLPFPASQYRYDVPAAQAAIVGNWGGSLSVGDLRRRDGIAFVGGAAGIASSSITVASDGAVTGTSAGCSFTGTIRPRSGGKNIFDVKITFGASPCTYPGLSTGGLGFVTLLPDGRSQIIVAGTNVDRTSGALFAANR